MKGGNPLRVGAYRRVSTEMQRDDGVSLQTQDERLKAFVQSQGWTLVENYADEGYSAKNMDRPALKRLIEDIKSQKIDVVLVYKLDRFVRSVSDLHYLLQVMDKYDVKFKSCTEVFDTTSATGRMFITIIATLAQWERETIAERVFDNMLHRSEQGKRNGGPSPYGYKLEDGILTIDENEAVWVRYMFQKYKTNGAQNIAKDLNGRGIRTGKGEVWSDYTVRYILRNPIYAGYVRWNNRSAAKGKNAETVIAKYEQENFEPLISKDDWDEIQALMKERSFMAFRSDNHYPFSSVAKCEKCGQAFTGGFKKKRSGGIHRFYKCSGRFRTGICNIPAIAEQSIEKAFLETMYFSTYEYLTKEPEIDKEQIKNELVHIEGKKERIKELYVDGDIAKGDYRNKIAELQERENDLLLQLETEDVRADEEEIRMWISSVKDNWNTLSDESKKAAVHAIFRSITIRMVEPPKSGKYPKPPVVEIVNFELR
ncbi:recombinase family protein [Brevibacillus laterosporus]|uniref:recombinase family protein n=1 Tax=Brevibacillus laterosporus TaxID=1465 RepID=UPI00215C5B63|nr:recombinase family protein [Brevibacillus laterosporus]MCR8994527.1 recombinase family protein [Brevibacillus laterosporus]